MARQLGSPFWLLVIWLVMGMMAVAGGLSFGALAARYPEAGGAYVYLREAYGPRLAFLYGWMQLLALASNSPRQSLWGVLVVLLGVPAFRLIRL
jgi:APA family basic amino acid/polyamine antiporter